jgi:hypothetical protein
MIVCSLNVRVGLRLVPSLNVRGLGLGLKKNNEIYFWSLKNSDILSLLLLNF